VSLHRGVNGSNFLIVPISAAILKRFENHEGFPAQNNSAKQCIHWLVLLALGSAISKSNH
jgi:hypothetical protein